MRLILIIIFLGSFTYAYSQDTLSFPRLCVTIKPLGFVDPVLPNFSGGVQFKATRHVVVEFIGGVIQSFYSFPFTGEENVKKSGYRVTAEIKYLLFKRLYFGLQGFYNKYTKTNSEFVWRVVKTYEQQLKLTKEKNVIGVNLKFGFRFLRRSQRFYYDSFAGVGMRYRDIKFTDLPSDAETIKRGKIAPDLAGPSVLPSLSLGITIGYKLLK